MEMPKDSIANKVESKFNMRLDAYLEKLIAQERELKNSKKRVSLDDTTDLMIINKLSVYMRDEGLTIDTFCGKHYFDAVRVGKYCKRTGSLGQKVKEKIQKIIYSNG